MLRSAITMVLLVGGCDTGRVSGHAEAHGRVSLDERPASEDNSAVESGGPSCAEVAAKLFSTAGETTLEVGETGATVSVDSGELLREALVSACKKSGWSEASKNCLIEKSAGGGLEAVRRLRLECDLN